MEFHCRIWIEFTKGEKRQVKEVREIFDNNIQYLDDNQLKQLLFMIADILGIDEDINLILQKEVKKDE